MVRGARIPSGKAHLEGRQPSHDGEYYTLYYRGEEWSLSDNAGVIASHWQTISECDWASEDANIQEAMRLADAIGNIMAGGHGWPVHHLEGVYSLEARKLAQEWGWFANA